MDRIREILRNPTAAAAAGFVLGLIIGLPILGWGLWPVQWVDASPSHLVEEHQVQYLCMTIDSFARNMNAAQARSRFKALGERGAELLNDLRPGTCNLTESDINLFAAAVGSAVVQLPEATPAVTEAAAVGEQPAGEEQEESGGILSRIGLLIGLCLATLVVGAVLVYVLLLRKPRPAASMAGAAPVREFVRQPARPMVQEEPQEEAPVVQFMTTFMAGDEIYDDSFSIDSQTGEFLGECGVGVAEHIGVGEPKKVTAFEVWLFDKNDIQTVTKVLMSEHAYNDPQIRARLASKGEPMLIEPDKVILLETATLILEARVVDMSYGQGPLPDRSFFERMTLELAVWPKPEY